MKIEKEWVEKKRGVGLVLFLTCFVLLKFLALIIFSEQSDSKMKNLMNCKILDKLFLIRLR